MKASSDLNAVPECPHCAKTREDFDAAKAGQSAEVLALEYSQLWAYYMKTLDVRDAAQERYWKLLGAWIALLVPLLVFQRYVHAGSAAPTLQKADLLEVVGYAAALGGMGLAALGVIGLLIHSFGLYESANARLYLAAIDSIRNHWRKDHALQSVLRIGELRHVFTTGKPLQTTPDGQIAPVKPKQASARHRLNFFVAVCALAFGVFLGVLNSDLPKFLGWSPYVLAALLGFLSGLVGWRWEKSYAEAVEQKRCHALNSMLVMPSQSPSLGDPTV
jgi:hypothetical protein